jgi:SnoaL-like protein
VAHSPSEAADDVEAIRLLKARYCRFLDTRDIEAWRALFAPDVTVLLDLAVSTGGADPQTMPPIDGLAAFEPVVLGGIGDAATMHHCHAPEIELTALTTATGIWAMEDLLIFPDGSQLHGAGHYHESYEKCDERWRITRLHLTRTMLRFTPAT